MYTIQEVADMLGLYYRTVWNYIRSGKIKAIKFGNVWRISKEELENVKNNGVR